MFLKIVIIRGTFLLFHLLLRYAISFLFVPLERVTLLVVLYLEFGLDSSRFNLNYRIP